MRLTNAIRKDIVKKAVERSEQSKTVNKLAEKVKAMHVLLITECWGGPSKYNALLKAAEATGQKLRISSGAVNVGGKSVWLSGVLPSKLKTITGKLAEDYWSLAAEREEALRAKYLLQENILAITNSVTTTKKLIEIWPECAELIPIEERKAKLPAIQFDQINKDCGLTSKK